MAYDIQPHESKLALESGSEAGKYLEIIRKTDLMHLTQEEWKNFCEIMCMYYKMNEIQV